MSKFYCYDRYEDVDLRNKQIVYLYYCQELTPMEISRIVGLSNTTISNYKRKYKHLLEDAKNLFTTREPKNRIDMPIKNIQFAETDGQKFYLIEIVNKISGELIASKIGTTKRPLEKRLKEHCSYYTQSYGVPVQIEVKRVYDCGECPAEYYESYFRAFYIAKHFGTFVKNDRFANVVFDFDEADKIFSKWKKNLG